RQAAPRAARPGARGRSRPGADHAPGAARRHLLGGLAHQAAVLGVRARALGARPDPAGGRAVPAVKATMELHERLEGEAHRRRGAPAYAGFGVVVAQIVALDAVFSLDSVIT